MDRRPDPDRRLPDPDTWDLPRRLTPDDSLAETGMTLRPERRPMDREDEQ